jgi:hypothetical protein
MRDGKAVPMFERFTDRARRVVVLAQEEARLLNHNYIGTEHILLGLIHEGEGRRRQALESLGISLEAVRPQVEEIIGHGPEAPTGHIPFTPRAKKVLELSLREALHSGPQLHRHRAHPARADPRGRGAWPPRCWSSWARPRPGPPAGRPEPWPMSAAPGRAGRGHADPDQPGCRPWPWSPAAPASTGEQAELVRVVPLAREVFRGNGLRVVLISLEVWSGWLDLRYVMLPEEPGGSPAVPRS